MKNAAELFKKILESSDRPAVKLTIERDGEAPIVIEDAQEFALFSLKNGVFYPPYRLQFPLHAGCTSCNEGRD